MLCGCPLTPAHLPPRSPPRKEAREAAWEAGGAHSPPHPLTLCPARRLAWACWTSISALRSLKPAGGPKTGHLILSPRPLPLRGLLIKTTLVASAVQALAGGEGGSPEA